MRIYAQDGSSVSDGRTYRQADDYELNPGVYDVEVMALALDGAETTHRFEDVSIVGGEVVEVEHEFKSGTLSVSVNGTDGIVDAMISITDTNTGASIAGGRSYTSASNNPRQFILNPGTYEVTLNALGEHSGKTETFSIVVEEGKTTEKITTF